MAGLGWDLPAVIGGTSIVVREANGYITRFVNDGHVVASVGVKVEARLPLEVPWRGFLSNGRRWAWGILPC